MAARVVESYNVALMEASNYRNIGQLKNLLRNYNNLYSLTQFGDSVAASIYLDLKTALDPTNKVLTEIQWNCLTMYYIDRMYLREIAELFNRNESTIFENINGGVKRIQRALISGELYGKGEVDE